MSMIIRLYKPEDRCLIRDICCSVANRGEPIDCYFPEKEVTADLLTSYYLDYEPESVFVATVDQRVVGYVTGTLDNRCYGLVMIFLILPKLFLKALVRGVFIDKHVRCTIQVLMRNWKRIFTWRKRSFNSHEAHLHIGILSGYRDRGVGKKLIEVFESYALSKNVALISASVHSCNLTACKFFEQQGFFIKFSYPTQALYKGQQENYMAHHYVKELH